MWEWLKNDTNSLRLAGLGQVLGALDMGQTADVSPFLNAIAGKERDAEMKAAIESGGFMDKFSPEERSFLATLGPEAATPLIAERVFGSADPVDLQTFSGPDGTVYKFNPRTGEATPMTGAEQTARHQQISGQEAAARGLDPKKVYNLDPDGKISEIGGGGVTVNNMPGADKFDEAFAKGDADTIIGLSDAGLAANRNMGRIDQLDALLKQSPSGFSAMAAQTAGEWGINTEGLDTVQAAQAMINSLVPEQRQPGSGPMSDSDLALFKQSLPRLINQPGGNQMIIETMRGIAQYDAEGGQIVQLLRNGKISRAEAFDLLQNRKNPLAGFKGSPALKSSASDSDLLKKYGVE